MSIDTRDRVYVLNRGEHPIIVYKKDGTFIGFWGEGMFQNAHGAYIDDQAISTASTGTATSSGSSPQTGSSSSHGGSPGTAPASSTSPTASGSERGRSTSRTVRTTGSRSSPPTASTSRSGGASSSRARDGEVLARIGDERSKEPGLFYAPHCTWTDSEGSLYVGEVLEGQRIQKFVRK